MEYDIQNIKKRQILLAAIMLCICFWVMIITLAAMAVLNTTDILEEIELLKGVKDNVLPAK